MIGQREENQVFVVPFVLWIKEEKYYNIVKETFIKILLVNFLMLKKINTLLEDHFNNKRNNGRKIYTIYTFLNGMNNILIKR